MTPPKPNPIQCPSCYRRGEHTIIEPWLSFYALLHNGDYKDLWIYECEACAYETTETDILLHAYRASYHRILNVVLSIRNWCAPSMNTEGGKLWVISRAIETYFEKNQQ